MSKVNKQSNVQMNYSDLLSEYTKDMKGLARGKTEKYLDTGIGESIVKGIQNGDFEPMQMTFVTQKAERVGQRYWEDSAKQYISVKSPSLKDYTDRPEIKKMTEKSPKLKNFINSWQETGKRDNALYHEAVLEVSKIIKPKETLYYKHPKGSEGVIKINKSDYDFMKFVFSKSGRKYSDFVIEHGDKE